MSEPTAKIDAIDSIRPKRKLSFEVVSTLDSIWRLEKIILDTLDFREIVQKVVDSILLELGYLELGYKVVVLALVDEKEQVLKRVSLSRTEEARKTREVSEMSFQEIKISLNEDSNLCIKAIKEQKVQITHYFPDILTPPISKENAIESQRNAGIQASMVYPLILRGKSIGIMIFSMNKTENDVSEEEKSLLRYFTDLVAMAVQNSKLYSNLEDESDKMEKLNVKLQQANVELIKLDNLKDEFLSVTSHELRTPMTIIKSYLWMLKQGKSGALNEKQLEYIDKASNGTERMLSLINDMLNISRIEQGREGFKIEEIDLGTMATETLEDFKIKAQENNITLEIIKEGSEFIVFADKTKTTEVLLNLVGNSMKFTKHGGIKVVLKSEEQFVNVEVTDTGAGIEKDDMNMLFHKFGRIDSSYRTVAESGGTGLGLYIVKLYIENMGGEVGAKSEGKNKGSTFWFKLPKKHTK